MTTGRAQVRGHVKSVPLGRVDHLTYALRTLLKFGSRESGQLSKLASKQLTDLVVMPVDLVDGPHQLPKLIKVIAGDRLYAVLDLRVTVMEGDEEALTEDAHLLGTHDE